MLPCNSLAPGALHLLVAAAAPGSDLFRQTLPWILLILGLVIIGGAVMILARRYARNPSGGRDVVFTLQDLREMHARGELSDEEFERARASLIGVLRAPAKDRAAGKGSAEAKSRRTRNTDLDITASAGDAETAAEAEDADVNQPKTDETPPPSA